MRCIQNQTSSAFNSRRSVVDYGSHLQPRLSSSPGAINTRPTPVYIALVDGRLVVAKFSKSRVWDEVPHGRALKTRCSLGRGKPVCKKKQLDTRRQLIPALAQRRVIKTVTRTEVLQIANSPLTIINWNSGCSRYRPMSVLSPSADSFLKMLRLVRFGRLRRCEALPKNLQITY